MHYQKAILLISLLLCIYLPTQVISIYKTITYSQKQKGDRLEDFNQKYLWGTYKPQLIHAITQRDIFSNKPITVGLMYYDNVQSLESSSDIQYVVKERKGDETIYNFKYHDGYQFAQHTVQDPYLNINFENSFFKLSYTKEHQEWIDVMKTFEPFGQNNNNNEKDSEEETFMALYYVNLEQYDPDEHYEDRQITVSQNENGIVVKVGNQFVQQYISFYGTGVQYTAYTIFNSDNQRNYNMKEEVYEWVKNGSQAPDINKGSYIVLQFEVPKSQNSDYELIIHYDNQQPNFSPVHFPTLEQTYIQHFLDKYQNVFGTPLDNFAKEEWDCGMSSFSDLIGGIQYSFGSLHCVNKDLPNCQAKLPMFTHTPSRVGFPRPFLWDEGFHLQVSCQWDREFCINDIENWFATQSFEGWIPREQPRGPELQSYISGLEEDDNEANPQTLMWSLSYIYKVAKSQLDEYMIERVEKLLPKIDKWFDWWQNTQKVDGYNLYKWWGPDESQNLGSGMDDFPRSDGDYYSVANIDASSWMVNFCLNIYYLQKDFDSEKASSYMKIAGEIMGDIEKYLKDDATLQYRDLLYNPNTGDYKLAPYNGYPDYIPLGLYLLSQNDQKLIDAQADYLFNKETIWSDFGVRSLSQQSDFFGEGSNYWRGPIWVNINYMLLNSIHQFYNKNEKAQTVYTNLRQNLASNVCKNYREKGYFFETFNKPPNDTGEGSNNHPFNGWTSTVTLAITEKYINFLN